MARDTKFRFTFWKLVFLLLMAAGLYATFLRFTRGLGASTNLNDQFPWGIWISFDVLCGVMLAVGASRSRLRCTFSTSSDCIRLSAQRFLPRFSDTSWSAPR